MRHRHRHWFSIVLTLAAFLSVFAGLNLLPTISEADDKLAREPPKTLTVDLGGGVKMEFVLIPKGKFSMGSPKHEKGRNTLKAKFDGEQQHEVEITKPFYLAKYPVTQEQYEAITGKNPSYFSALGGGKDEVKGMETKQFPVETVMWDEAMAYCEKISKNDKEKRKFRLPTEAEWEYACRAGTKTAYSFGDDPKGLGDYAWFLENSGFRTHPVGEKKANPWGLFDVHGNVWQWCEDRLGEYPKAAVTDPLGPERGSFRIIRGGCWLRPPRYCRSANRHQAGPAHGRSFLGFRLAVPVA